MENRAFAIATGASVLILTALLLLGAFWLGGGNRTGVPYDLVSQASVAGLSTGAPVRFDGVEVGQVQSIGLDPSDPRRVRVRVLLDPKLHLMQGTQATVLFLGISGSAYVELGYPASSSQPLESSAAAPARIPMQPGGLDELVRNGNRLIQQLSGTLHRVDALVSPQNAQQLSQLLARFDAAADGVNSLTHQLLPAARRLDVDLADADQLVNSTRSTVRDFDSVILDANAPGGTLDALRSAALKTGNAAHSVNAALVDGTLPRLDELAERLAITTDSLNVFLQQLQNQPQSLIFGRPRGIPGPGEPGFHMPHTAQATQPPQTALQ